MEDAFGTVVVVVVAVSAVVAIVTMFLTSGMYKQIGRGGLSIGDDRDVAPRPAAPAVLAAERDDEIRQMLAARNARRAARGEATVDVEAELAQLTRPAVDPELEAEVRQLVVARNRRLVDRGKPPLDVDAEVARRLRELGG